MKPDRAKAAWNPQRCKSFQAYLKNLIANEYPRFGGPKIIDMFINDTIKAVDQFYPPRHFISKGQFLWVAVDKSDFPKKGKSMKNTKTKALLLPLVTDEDIKELERGTPLKKVNQKRIARVILYAYKMGALLSQTELCLIFAYNQTYLRNMIEDYEKENNIILPTRGSIHDLGAKVSHKKQIVSMRYLQNLETPDIAKKSFHSPQSVDRYIEDFNRVKFCKEKNMSLQEIAFSTKMSISLVKEYNNLIKELDNVHQ